MVVINRHGFEEVEQRSTVVPRSALRLLHHIVAIKRRKRDASHIGDAQRSDKLLVLAYNFIETLFGEVHQVHLINGKHHMLDTQQRYKESMTARLRDDTRAGIYQNNRQICGRAAGNHVTRILFVSRSVGNDEFTVIRGEVAIGHVDSNALLTLRLQTVQQQGIVDVVAGITHTFAVALQRIQLVFIQFLTIEQQTSDKRGLSVIHRTGSKETKQIFLFVFIKESLYIKS